MVEQNDKSIEENCVGTLRGGCLKVRVICHSLLNESIEDEVCRCLSVCEDKETDNKAEFRVCEAVERVLERVSSWGERL